MIYYFIGIKGTGMASLALMLHNLGNEVMGSDLKNHFFTEDALVEKGIKILEFNPNNIKDNYTVVIGNAFLEDFEEVKAARSNPTCKCYRYHEFLGEFMKNYKTISVSGSHGKTTTTTMLKTVFEAFKPTAYLIGDGEGYVDKTSEYLCVEACEFRRHFLAYHPDYAIINNIEIDHVDYFKDEEDYFNAYQEYVENVSKAVFINGDDKWCQKLKFKDNLTVFTYGLNDGNDFTIKNIEENESGSKFDFYFKGDFIYRYSLPFVGNHLLIDVLSVISVATIMCFEHQKIENALTNYVGPKRRYVVEKHNDTIFVDDYAHHPTEVKVTIEASKKRFPDKKTIAIFKPHRASRVKYFVDEFKDALKLADEIYLLDFTSIDDKQDGTDIDINYLKDRLPNSHVITEDEEGAKELARYKGECLVFMSSKDIYHLAEKVKKLI